VSTPLLLACLAGLYSERSGVFDIGLEGKMLAAAFAGAAACRRHQLGLARPAGRHRRVAATSGAGRGFASSPIAATRSSRASPSTFIAPAPPSSSAGLVRAGRAHAALAADGRFGNITLPFADALGRAGLGPDLFRADFRPQPARLCRLPAVPITWWVLYRTRFGLRLRAVGENPKAVDTAGISVVRLRYQAVLHRLLCGLAGAFFSIAQAPASATT
jgi:ABC-type uncharacterized transport system permease subunit